MFTLSRLRNIAPDCAVPVSYFMDALPSGGGSRRAGTRWLACTPAGVEAENSVTEERSAHMNSYTAPLAPDVEITMRAADTEKDWPRIWPLWRAVVSRGETHPYPVDATEAEARTIWLAPSRSAVYIAEREGALVAAMMTKPMRSGNGDHIANFDLMVAPEWWGQGIGRALATYVIDATQRAGYLAMEAYSVVDTNEQALKLWNALGFRTLATVPDAFRHPVHGLVGVHLMHRQLVS
ncbi:GNAT family N-acetyltransferase [Streptomyces sp. NPDC001508]|uniref:GNAT family N-acetyltransferase n=1 Tax=Streptomyces sp. NPDC001508 TaxID=3154656 RepID=UPI0033230EE3